MIRVVLVTIRMTGGETPDPDNGSGDDGETPDPAA